MKRQNHLRKQKLFGTLNSIRIYIQIKKNIGINREEINEKIDITKLSYDATYNLIIDKINDIDLLITSKIKYWIKYSNKLGKKPKFLNTFTFSDTKIYYPNLVENTTFYTNYLLNYKFNKQKIDNKTSIENLTLEYLYNKNINISDIIKYKHCGIKNNNCNYIGVNSLKIDLILMLQYAEFINYEKYENDNNNNIKIIVPISSLFKYIKYLIKYLRLYIIIKFYNKTLNKNYTNATIKFIQYIKKIITTTSIEPEHEPMNLQYKKTINKLHQDFFINQTMFPEFNVLKEVVTEYNYIKNYINKSRFLFKEEFEKYKKYNKNNVCESVNLLNILDIIFTVKKDNKYIKNIKVDTIVKGGSINDKCNKTILYSNDNDINKDYDNIYKSIKSNKSNKSNKDTLLFKYITNLLKEEINNIEQINKSL